MKLILLLSAMVTTMSVLAQSTEDSVKAAVTNMFDAMRNADAVALKSVFSSNAVFHTIVTGKDGQITVRNEEPAEFIAFVSKEKKGAADERIRIESIRIDGPLAMIWAPYQFFYNGVFSHCGVDSFQLVRIAGEWKVQYIIDTRRKTGCE